jgi:hypothetical protein
LQTIWKFLFCPLLPLKNVFVSSRCILDSVFPSLQQNYMEIFCSFETHHASEHRNHKQLSTEPHLKAQKITMKQPGCDIKGNLESFGQHLTFSMSEQ